MRSTKFIAIVFAAAPLFAQQEYSKQEVSVQALGSFVKTINNDGVSQSATNSGGVLADYRYFFDKHNGVEVNYAFTSDTQKFSGVGVDTRSNEGSAAYVFRIPLKHFTPFLLAGAGGLVFSPRDFVGASTQARVALVYGGGADFAIGSHVFLRAQYRGLVYDSPTFESSTLGGFDKVTHRAEPSIGFGYRF